MDDYPLLNLFWTMFWFFLWIMWLFLLFKIITDIFRDDELSGWGKAGWLIFCIVLPYLGVLVYVIARGKGMTRRDAKQAKDAEAAFQDYIRKTAGTAGTAGGTGAAGGAGHGGVDELTRLADLKDRGALTHEEFEKAKARVLS
ncbi:SHOCT domain-containing protein [Streptomyces roseicoloratus]|uniref:SHOCT domain-containing protein n=1 Tax=Streptomyces roseicoloratus TaxID=2508722 RepID=A0ABY9RQE1_9ACTN|nr:SHOCT domain-containing protein [Streptomyces roseicoloratus]WMX43681.1 SHOCT domain-containing protein [Streptomyces roseicoloratus]